MEGDASRWKATAMAVSLALSFGGCAGYAVGVQDSTSEIAVAYRKGQADAARRWTIPRRIYRSDEDWRRARAQAAQADQRTPRDR